MSLFVQIIRLFTLCCIGDVISMLLPFPFPGSVIALVILFLLLLSGVIKTKQINTLSDFLLKNMSFVFLPSTVSIISYIDVFKSIIWQFLFICIITTVITFFATAYAVKFTVYLMNKFRKEPKDA